MKEWLDKCDKLEKLSFNPKIKNIIRLISNKNCGQRMKILLVEDDKEISALYKIILEGRGHQD
jgi:hypothetical protein